MPINIEKLRFVDFIKASTSVSVSVSVSVKFTVETSFTEVSRIVDYKYVKKDTKFGEYIALVNRTTGTILTKTVTYTGLFKKCTLF